MSSQQKKRFYHDGIRFGCLGDGKCCVNHGRYAFVYLSFKDRKRLSVRLGMPLPEFQRIFTSVTDGRVHLNDVDNGCPFLEKGSCRVHDARPRQCRTWPFWPQNMHPLVWQRDVAGFCPGVGRGRLYSAFEIELILKKQGEVVGYGTGHEQVEDSGPAKSP